MSIVFAVLIATIVIAVGLLLYVHADAVGYYTRSAMCFVGVFAFGATSALAGVTVYGYRGGYLALANVSDYGEGDHSAVRMASAGIGIDDDVPMFRPNADERAGRRHK